jgi:tRNA A37 threonylcarbamoyladenosine modification protein TsaB
VALDARRGHIYAARFARAGSDLALRGEYLHVEAQAFAAALPEGCFVLGDARRSFPVHFRGFPGDADAPVRPDVVARLAADLLARGETLSPEGLRPLYLRLSDPEIRHPSP